MIENSIALPAKFAEIRVRGKTALVPSVEIEGRTVIATGSLFKLAAIRDADVVEDAPVKDPQAFIAALKTSGLQADVFTFFQRPPDVSPRFDFHFEWDNYAAVVVSTFEDWWEKLPQETRKNVRRAAKRGVTAQAVPFDDELARGIWQLCNESPMRQGKPFWHFGKDFETVKREHSTYEERSDFIGAYFEGHLIGFIKMVYVDSVAFILHILASNAYTDKRPINALIAKAVEVCAQKGMRYFVYDHYVYGNKTDSSLVEFKRRNGFEQVRFPRYYIPLTLKGKIVIHLKLYRGLVGLLPAPVLKLALAARNWIYELKGPKQVSG
ncbi:MAG TPA: hypothetical protein VGI03_15025 [Verrucomicrobiae bacterium]|jgi:hypothetical protein